MFLGPDASAAGVHGRACSCFSPEPFVRVRGREISTFPMKGTADAATLEARRWLEEDEKENRESATIVDLMRNEPFHGGFPGAGETLPLYQPRGNAWRDDSAMQFRNRRRFAGKLAFRLGEIIMALLPAGSVTGAPKEATCRAIAEAEDMERGFVRDNSAFSTEGTWTPPSAIRFMEEDGANLVYKSGGGITVMSRMEDEYREAIAKVYVPFDL